MEIQKPRTIILDSTEIKSETLERTVQVDFYLPRKALDPSDIHLLLVNDGQDMEELGLKSILEELYDQNRIAPLLVAAIHAGPDRKQEYGTATMPDYKGRGSRAKSYTDFILRELIPGIKKSFQLPSFKEKAFAGFSLGALSALDIVWNHPEEFSRAGVFSGSLWWRTRDKHDPFYSDHTDRIMHQQIRRGHYYPWLKFFFECGGADEGEDRNHNGIIDSIDDTLDLIEELKSKGYPESHIQYLLLEEGRHDVATWSLAMPGFLTWGWGKSASSAHDGASTK
jgi:enterochelin esterase-like enzyme